MKIQSKKVLLRLCNACNWTGCDVCVSDCHSKVKGCDGTPKTYDLEKRGWYKCPCSCLVDGSTEVEKVEGDYPHVSYQGLSKTCACHATGKAVVKLMDDKGYDVNQEEVIDILKNSVRSPVNTDAFNGMKIRIMATNKGSNIDGEKEVKVEVKDINLEEVEMKYHQAIVIRWEFECPRHLCGGV